MNCPAVDPAARKQLALLLRRLAAGRISTQQYEVQWTLRDSTDPAIAEIGERFDQWSDSFFPFRFTGDRRLSRRARRAIARIVLFLRSATPYPWGELSVPVVTQAEALPDDGGFGSVELTCPGRLRRRRLHDLRAHRRLGLYAWPHASREALNATKSKPTFLYRSPAMTVMKATETPYG